MELKYIVLTIIKILISVPGVLLLKTEANGAALMGGHLDNKSNATIRGNLTDSYDLDFDLYDEQELSNNNATKSASEIKSISNKNHTRTSEEIPDPEPLVVPGYNLPENIFNKGKPFYLEKDPLTGAIDFNSKSHSLEFEDEEYEYVDDEPHADIYDKSNIDRKDGSLYSHKPSDVNQLTPNFHDFLNLPVKYNPDKYVYPLISSSYANTKVQGNVNKHYNHKEYSATTYKPIFSPAYYTTKTYFKTTQKPEYTTRHTTTASTTKKQLTTNIVNLMNSAMNHPSFDDNTIQKTERPIEKETQKNNVYLTTKSTTQSPTTKEMSLFEQLFGDYEETTTTKKPKAPSLFSNLPPQKTETTTATQIIDANIPIKQEANYDYDDYSNEYPITDNIAVETKPVKTESKHEKPLDKPKPNTGKPKQENKNYPNKKETYSQIDDSYFVKPDKFETVIRNENPTVVYSERATTTTLKPTSKVTSLPLGENHVTHNIRQPIIVSTHNLKEQLNNEKVPMKPYVYEKGALPPSTSNIHIAPDQDVVSFVVGNHQSVDGGQYVGVSFKESPYDHNPFRPLYAQNEPEQPFSNPPIQYQVDSPEVSGSSVSIQPIRNSEASLTIGSPINNIKVKVPGQVVDDSLDIGEEIEFPKGTGAKVVFPEDKQSTTFTPDFVPPLQSNALFNQNLPQAKPLPAPPNREVLQLNSKPMFHQLPSDLTPPSQKDPVPPRLDRIRPPWDPRPGHFYSGRPEYARPPRPPIPQTTGEIYKRIDNLPNILPQFRPNSRISSGPYYYENTNKKPFLRQPLLERPSNNPIGLLENLQPPPPPKNIHNARPPVDFEIKLRQNHPSEHDFKMRHAENYIGPDSAKKPNEDQFEFYQTPPKVVISNRRNSDVDAEVETLQMIQAKKNDVKESTTVIEANQSGNESADKPLYVVYPVNTPPLKLDMIDDSNKKETVVIGTRAELPLPPSEINQFSYEETPLLSAKDRNDAPILKPHPRPAGLPIRFNFPYPIERPDPSVLNPAVPDNPSHNNHIDIPDRLIQDSIFKSSNQWNTVEDPEARIVTGSKINTQQPNQISVTLKTYTEKPIAVAYTPTEAHYAEYTDKFSMPNYGGAVIPEIRPGSVGSDNSEFTVSAVMHTHPHVDLATQNMEFINKHKQEDNHRSDNNDMYTTHVPAQDFQAPFQASVNLDHQSISQGWSVIRDKNKPEVSSTPKPESTTLAIATTSEFDIENFKPQLIGGFKPLYNFPEDETKKEAEISERQE